MSKPVTLGSFFEIAKGRWAEVRGFYEPPTLAKPAIPEDFMPWLFEGVKGGALEARLIAPSGGGANPSGGLWGSVKDAGLQAMGKRSREKRERRESGETRAPRSDVQVFDDGISVHGGAKGPFTIFYLKARKEWQTDSGPDKKNARDVMVFLDEHGHFAAAVRYAIVVEGGDHKTYKALGVLHSRPMSDDRIGEVEAFVDAEYARLFPYDSGLPVENNIFGWLIARLSDYKAGRISAAQIADCIGSFADVSPVKPELTETGFRFGPVEVSGSEALKIVIKGAETIIADRLRGDREASRLAEQISASFRENRAGQTTAHGSGISSVSKAVEAVSISQMLGYLKNSDVPVGIREKTAVIYVLGGEEGSLLSDMFGSNIEVEAAATGRGKSIDFVLQPARLSPEAFCAKVEASYRAFFGIKDNPDVRDIAEEREITPFSLVEFSRSKAVSDKVNPRRSLTLFTYKDYFIRLMASQLPASSMGVAILNQGTVGYFQTIRRLLSNRAIPDDIKIMAADVTMHVQAFGLKVFEDVSKTARELEKNIVELCAEIRRIYLASYPEASAVLRAAENLPKNDVRNVLLSETFSEPGVAMAWTSFLAEGRRQGVEKERALEIFAEACDPAGSDQKIYENWIKNFAGLSTDERARLWSYFKSNNPHAITALFQDRLFPPRGAWAKGDAFVNRMGFLLPSELEGLQATLAAAAEDTTITYSVFTRRYPDAPFYTHSDLPMWLKFWPQNGGNTAALDNALRELSRWVHGEGPLAVDPMLARELVRRSIGDTLAIRSLIDFVSNSQFNLTQRQAVLAEVSRVLSLGQIEGDLLGLVMRANARMNGRGPLPSKAELSTVKNALKNGWKVKLIPTDKKLDGPTPDIEVTDAKGRKVVVEVKTVRRLSQEDRSLGYLTTLRAQIADAARQLDKYDAGDARRVVHIYIVGCGVGQVSSLAMQVAEDAVAEYEAQRGIAEIALIPVDTTGDSWREAEWVRGTFEEKEEYLNRNWKILECLSPNERRRALQLLHDEWERGAPLERGPFEEYVTRRVAALASGASAEGKDAAAAAGERDRTEEGRKEGAGRDRPEDKEKADRPAEGVK